MCVLYLPAQKMSQHKFGPFYSVPEQFQVDSDSPGVSDGRSCALLSCLLPSPQLHGGKGRHYLKPAREESWICICDRWRGEEIDYFGNSCLCGYLCFEGVVVL